MRIAWLGPEPSLEGGVPYTAAQILVGLAEQGVQIDAYIPTLDAGYGDHFAGCDGLRVYEDRIHWNWARWYSRQPLIATGTLLAARVRAQRRLLATLAREHAQRPYDLVYQFSQFEVPWLRGRASDLPPVVVHPEVHMAGELRWHRRERALAVRCGGKLRTEGTTALLAGRTLVQRRDARRVAAVIAPSRVFASHLETDYGIARERLHVVPNPIDLQRFSPGTPGCGHGDPIELLFVSRVSVRKGVEMIVALSHRLANGPGRFRLRVVGAHSMFSDYRPLLTNLHPDVGCYEGGRKPHEVAQMHRSADMVLQPSHYEPFALTIGEALASGAPVVTSDEVGASEDVDARCAYRFPAGDLAGFESAVRAMTDAISNGQRDRLRSLARREAVRLFAPEKICRALVDTFDRVLLDQRLPR
jgi:glycosyltransferase involved in cell wall biosynthesis